MAFNRFKHTIAAISGQIEGIPHEHWWFKDTQIQSNELELTGADENYVRVDGVDDINDFITATAAWTISLDLQADSSQTKCIFGMGRGTASWTTGGHSWLICQTAGNVEFQYNSGGFRSISGVGDITSSKIRVTAVSDGTRISLYVGVSRIATTAVNISITTPTGGTLRMTEGSTPDGNLFWDGSVDVIDIRKGALVDPADTTIVLPSLLRTIDTLYFNPFTGANGTTPENELGPGESTFNPNQISDMDLELLEGVFTDSSTHAATITNSGVTVNSGGLNGHDLYVYNNSIPGFIKCGANAQTAYDRDTPFTMDGMFKFDNLTGSQFVAAREDNSGIFQGYHIQLLSGGQILFVMQQTNSPVKTITVQASGFTISVGVWYRITITFSGNSSATGVKIYINGTELLTAINQNNTDGSTASSVEFTAGSRDGGGVAIDAESPYFRLYGQETPSAEVIRTHNYEKVRYSI